MEESLSLYLDEIENIDPNLVSPLVLAYIGDAVYELIIRTVNFKKGNKSVNKFHTYNVKFVKAKTQAILGRLIKDELSSNELAIYKRGRNAKSHSIAKNATVSDYRYATAFESLIGYLYLKKENQRIKYLLDTAFSLFEEKGLGE